MWQFHIWDEYYYTVYINKYFFSEPCFLYSFLPLNINTICKRLTLGNIRQVKPPEKLDLRRRLKFLCAAGLGTP